MTNRRKGRTRPLNLISMISERGEILLDHDHESMWLDVIQKMDFVYSDLIRYEADLERKNAELEEAQSFISSVIASVSDILVVCDRNGVVLQVNRAFRELLGWPRGEPHRR